MGNELLQAIFNSISDGILVLDSKLNVIDFNKMALKILGMKKDILMKINIREIFDNYQLVDKCFLNNESYKREDCTFTVNKNKIRCVTNLVPIGEDNKIMGVVMTFRDTKHIHRMVNNVIGYTATYNFKDIITKNQYMKKNIQYAKKAANTDCNILLEGSSGTGKEVFAQAIHNYSRRAKAPFVAINCAAIPRELVESELFGYEKGAFTGANKGGYPGKFELADGGTIFLDEIGELPLDIQSKLLRVLDNHKIVRVGATYEKSINVRVISATNRNLLEEVDKKNFRYDLYYRLNVIGIHLMDLEDRKEDVEPLINHFMEKLNRNNLDNIKKIDEKAISRLREYKWEGNIRELRNTIEKAYYLCDNDIIAEKYILNLVKGKKKIEKACLEETINSSQLKMEDIQPLKIVEEDSIRKALIVCNGNVEEGAKILGISRATAYRKIIKYKIRID